jgi:hypothetical protein
MNYFCFGILSNFLPLESTHRQLNQLKPADRGPVSYLYIRPKINFEGRNVNVDIPNDIRKFLFLSSFFNHPPGNIQQKIPTYEKFSLMSSVNLKF